MKTKQNQTTELINSHQQDTVGVLSFLIMLLARSWAGAQLPQACPVSLWGGPAKGRGGYRTQGGQETAVPSTEQAVKGAEHCSQEPEVGVGKQGLCQFCGFRAHAQWNPPVPSCLPPCSVVCEPGTC